MRFHRVLFLALVALVAVGASSGAQSAGELLEKGIYTEETVGDLDAAIAIYERVVKTAEAERGHAARALYRIGCCYSKAGKNRQAEEAFRRLVNSYSDQTALAMKARDHLPALEHRELALRPAPWADGELLHFSVALGTGRHLGDMIFSVSGARTNERDVWRLESYMGAPPFGIVKYVRVDAEKESFLPIRSYFYHSEIGQCLAEYTSGMRKMMLNRPGAKPEPMEQKLATPVFDNEQNVFLVRRMPLADGYKAEVSFTGRPGVTYTVAVQVEGREVVEVPAGRFDCFRVSATVGGISEHYWIAANPRRTLVKTVSSSAKLKLVSIGRRSLEAAVRKLPDAGLSVAVPAGWRLVKNSVVSKHHGFAQLFAPELETWGMFYRVPANGQTARDRAEKQIAGMKKKVNGYTLRPGGIETRTLGGFPAVSFTSDLTLRGWPMTERQTCIQVSDSFYIVVFVTLSDNFARHEAAIESVLSTLAFTGN